MPRSHPPYPPEFRREAVELARVSDKSVPQLAKDLGISDQSLREWIKRADVDAGKREGLTTDEREELRRLRRENRTLLQEREILKKAAAFFARESERPVSVLTGSSPRRRPSYPVSLIVPDARRQPPGFHALGGPSALGQRAMEDAWPDSSGSARSTSQPRRLWRPADPRRAALAEGDQGLPKRVERLMAQAGISRPGAQEARPHHDPRARA